MTDFVMLLSVLAIGAFSFVCCIAVSEFMRFLRRRKPAERALTVTFLAMASAAALITYLLLKGM